MQTLRDLLASRHLTPIAVLVLTVTLLGSAAGPAAAGGDQPANTLAPNAPLVQAPTTPPIPVPPPAGIPGALWGDGPTLGTVPGQTYHGRIVAELWQNPAADQALYQPSTVRQHQFLEQRLAALEGQGSFSPTPDIWPPMPLTVFSLPDSGLYLGRVVIELWDSTTHVAVTSVNASAKDLVQQFIEDWTILRP